MTEQNPPGFLQNAGATHTAEQMRNWHGLLSAGSVSSLSMVPRGGVNPVLGNSLSVTQTGSPSMAVIVKSGQALIPGNEGAKQGVYSVLNDADLTLSIAASNPSLPRIDIVCFKVQDQAYSGATNTSSLVVVTGTAAASPAVPSAPANSITLAQVAVAAAATSISNANITDVRYYMAAAGGIIQCTAATRPASGTVPFGTSIYETDTGLRYFWHKDSTWFPVQPISKVKASTTSRNTVTARTNDPELVIAVAINATYVGELTLFANSAANAAGDLNLAFTGPAGSSMTYGGEGQDISLASGAVGTVNSVAASSGGITFGLSTTAVAIKVSIKVTTAGTAGNLALEWAQNSSNANNSSILSDSFWMMTRVS